MKRIAAILIFCILLMGSCFGAFAEGTADKSATSVADNLQILVENGIVSQETLENIIAFLEANPSEAAQPSDGSVPEKPDGQFSGSAPDMPGGNGSQPPEKPDGQAGGEPPEKPDGQPSGSAPEKSDGQQMMLMLSENQAEQLLQNGIITESEYTAILALMSSMQPAGKPNGNPPGGASSQSVSYTAVKEITDAEELSGGEYASETADESVILIRTDADVSLSGLTVSKTGDSDGGDTCSFYGLNAAVLAMGGANVTITGGTVTTDAKGANGVFSYGGNGAQNGAGGDGTTVNISDTVITTTGDNAGGLMTTGGGVTNADNLTIETSGRSSAAIRTDRGGGTVTVSGGSYTTNGLGSPAIYCTADIAVSDAALVSNQSEGVCIEGKNNVTLTNCDLTVSNTRCNGNATFLDSVMIYQSMSGDADSGVSTFTMSGGSLTSRSGHVFHVTNTHAVISLNHVRITNEDADNVLLSVCDDGWSGASNTAELNAVSQELSGKILVGSNSSLSLTLSGSSFTGSISGDITNSQGTVVSAETGTVSVSLDASSTWTLTADSFITGFEGDASQIILNGYTLYVNGTALEGAAE